MQSSVAARANHKLSFGYFGSYTVESKIGSMAYKLKLPESSSVHPVFHVSLLKRAVGPPSPLPVVLSTNLSDVQVPELVLDRRLKIRNKRAVQQILIKWKGWPPELSTWEDGDEVRPLLSSTTSCGQVVFQVRGMSGMILLVAR